MSPWWWGWGGGWGYYPYWSYPYYYSYSYPYPAYPAYPYPAYPYDYTGEEQAWVERPPEGGVRSSDRPEGYWYYCESKRGYYPRVPECPEEWIKVPPEEQR